MSILRHVLTWSPSSMPGRVSCSSGYFTIITPAVIVRIHLSDIFIEVVKTTWVGQFGFYSLGTRATIAVVPCMVYEAAVVVIAAGPFCSTARTCCIFPFCFSTKLVSSRAITSQPGCIICSIVPANIVYRKIFFSGNLVGPLWISCTACIAATTCIHTSFIFSCSNFMIWNIKRTSQHYGMNG